MHVLVWRRCIYTVCQFLMLALWRVSIICPPVQTHSGKLNGFKSATQTMPRCSPPASVPGEKMLFMTSTLAQNASTVIVTLAVFAHRPGAMPKLCSATLGLLPEQEPSRASLSPRIISPQPDNHTLRLCFHWAEVLTTHLNHFNHFCQMLLVASRDVALIKNKETHISQQSSSVSVCMRSWLNVTLGLKIANSVWSIC